MRREHRDEIGQNDQRQRIAAVHVVHAALPPGQCDFEAPRMAGRTARDQEAVLMFAGCRTLPPTPRCCASASATSACEISGSPVHDETLRLGDAARAARHSLQAAPLVLDRLVLPGRRAGHRRTVLSRDTRACCASSAACSAKPKAATGVGGYACLRHELGHAVDTAFGLRRRRDWQRSVRSRGGALLPRLRRSPREQGPRAASRALVCAEPSDRRLRRDVRRLAAAESALAARLRRLAGARQARIRRRASWPSSPAARRRSATARSSRR